jgi:hypothetical protein
MITVRDEDSKGWWSVAVARHVVRRKPKRGK